MKNDGYDLGKIIAYSKVEKEIIRCLNNEDDKNKSLENILNFCEEQLRNIKEKENV